ncbi:oxygen-dependent tRNA uridine(34) hydroxylase TrhO [Pelagibacterium xiamenense]|uniref:oxygen-dependent tRNA uridine(34) hydroxylase TrhO n=1 Tax=Pelagibacterium xiamenense TaxID=2901140 RepID=UPI001E30E95E|nr:rhodanese-related sulfurtransferase [Pelagibacterium xiamenense]MCD7058746.1 rhodanese-related sulfurtransferase [Pelagibacterium xiamenense]
MSDPAPVKIVALYKFVDQPDFETLRAPIAEFCCARGIRGTLLLAPEGINGTVAGTPDAIGELVSWLESGNIFGGRFAGAEIKYSTADTMPFHRMKVRLKEEIVTLRAPEANPGRQVGTYVDPEDWNALIEDEEIVLIDTRNDYEVGLGTFRNAVDPRTETFTAFKDYVAANLDPARHKKVAMFCTGGIRCEKASSYMLAQGFEEVYHLKGGILAYLEKVPQEQSRWEGECFVFDERVSVGHGLKIGEATLCRACRQPLSPLDRERPEFVDGVQCHHCAASMSEDKRAAAAERQRQIELATARGEAHMGADAAAAAEARRQANKSRRQADRQRNRAGELS